MLSKPVQGFSNLNSSSTILVFGPLKAGDLIRSVMLGGFDEGVDGQVTVGLVLVGHRATADGELAGGRSLIEGQGSPPTVAAFSAASSSSGPNILFPVNARVGGNEKFLAVRLEETAAANVDGYVCVEVC